MHNAKTDRNQKEIVDALRKAGFSVQCLSTVGKGFPDLLVGFMGSNYLIEVKDGLKSKLNEDQVKWHAAWEGQVTTIHNMKELAAFIGLRTTAPSNGDDELIRGLCGTAAVKRFKIPNARSAK